MCARTTLATLSLTVAVMIQADAVMAAPYWPWCGVFYHRSTARYCGFSSWEQCMDSVRGIGGYCYANLSPPPAAPLSKAKRRTARD